MRILKDFENQLEGAVEGFFARAFKSGLQPVELAKAIQRYENNYQQASAQGVIVPNVYRFTLSPADLDRFKAFTTSLQKELADVARRTAIENGWFTVGPIRIEFERSQEIKVGVFELRGKTEEPKAKPAPQQRQIREPLPVEDQQPAPAAQGMPPAAGQGMPPAQAPGSQTPGAGVPAAQTPGAGVPAQQPAQASPFNPQAVVLQAIEGSDAGRSWTITNEGLVGRLPECQVVLTGPSVSRRHAKVTHAQGGWHVQDLGSTNGIKVNNTQVASQQLQHGDRIEIGGVVMIINAAPEGA